MYSARQVSSRPPSPICEAHCSTTPLSWRWCCCWFLFRWRPTAISLIAIPVSLMAGVLVLWLFGIGINALTLGWLVFAIGEVVDDAIIDVENIQRRLRENKQAAQNIL